MRSLSVLFGLMALALTSHGAVAQAKPAAKLAGDAVAGAAAYKMRCAVCHGVQAEGGVIGPGLKGVFGAKGAAGPYAKYSPTLKAAKITWTAANLDSWLAAPAKIAPGTSMAVAVPEPMVRENLIAYLATLKAAK